MSDSIDPITLLRDTITSGKLDSIKFTPDTRELVFEKFEGGLKVPMGQPTAWKTLGGTGYFTIG